MKKLVLLPMLLLCLALQGQDGKVLSYDVIGTVTSSTIATLKVDSEQEEVWHVSPSMLTDAISISVKTSIFTAYYVEGVGYKGIYFEKNKTGLSEIRVSFSLEPTADLSGNYNLYGEKIRIDANGKKSVLSLQGYSHMPEDVLIAEPGN